MTAAIPPADADAPGGAIDGDGAARHTQPTFSAMITTESSGSPICVHSSAHRGAESLGSVAFLTPTGAAQADNETNKHIKTRVIRGAS